MRETETIRVPSELELLRTEFEKYYEELVRQREFLDNNTNAIADLKERVSELRKKVSALSDLRSKVEILERKDRMRQREHG